MGPPGQGDYGITYSQYTKLWWAHAWVMLGSWVPMGGGASRCTRRAGSRKNGGTASTEDAMPSMGSSRSGSEVQFKYGLSMAVASACRAIASASWPSASPSVSPPHTSRRRSAVWCTARTAGQHDFFLSPERWCVSASKPTGGRHAADKPANVHRMLSNAPPVGAPVSSVRRLRDPQQSCGATALGRPWIRTWTPLDTASGS